MYESFERSVAEEVYHYAGDVITSPHLRRELQYRQHGSVSCYEHSVAVAFLSVRMARGFFIEVDMESLIKGALLHDYFLYDWREDGVSRRDHGISHARRALTNARQDFELSEIACDVIEKHMFPLNVALPRYKESYIVSIADKLCASREICRFLRRKVFSRPRSVSA